MTKEQAINKVVNWALGELGYQEGPEDNWTKYAEDPLVTKLLGWKPQKQPWCDFFTDEDFLVNFGLEAAAAMTYQPIGKGSALCKTSAQFFKNNGAFFQSPERGDVIFFYVGGEINHQGIVVDVNGGLVYTVEGNSSDRVAKRVYGVGGQNIAGYGRPKWSVVVDQSADDETEIPVDAGSDTNVPTIEGLPMLQKGSVGEVVRAAQLLLIGRGYTCGSYGADADFGPATEMAVRNFQLTHSLDQDGVVGPQTWAALLGL